MVNPKDKPPRHKLNNADYAVQCSEEYTDFYIGEIKEKSPPTHGSTLEKKLLRPGCTSPLTLKVQGTLLWWCECACARHLLDTFFSPMMFIISPFIYSKCTIGTCPNCPKFKNGWQPAGYGEAFFVDFYIIHITCSMFDVGHCFLLKYSKGCYRGILLNVILKSI